MDSQQLQLVLSGVACVAAALSLGWIIYDSQRTDGAAGYRTAAMTAFVLSLFGLAFAAIPSLMENAAVTRTVILWLGVFSGLVAVVLLLVYVLRAGAPAVRQVHAVPPRRNDSANAGGGMRTPDASPPPRVDPVRVNVAPTKPGWPNPAVAAVPPTKLSSGNPGGAVVPPTKPSNEPGVFQPAGSGQPTIDLREDDAPETVVLRRPMPDGFVAWLACVAGPDAGRDIVLLGGDDIGHDKKCNICLSDLSVSGKHARVDFRDGHLTIRDLGSANRTFVNDEEVLTERVLVDKDRLRLGSSELIYLEVRPAAPPPAGTPSTDPPAE